MHVCWVVIGSLLCNQEETSSCGCSLQPHCWLLSSVGNKQTESESNMIWYFLECTRLMWREDFFHVINATGCVRGCVDGNNTYRCWFSTPSCGSCHFFFFHLPFFHVWLLKHRRVKKKRCIIIQDLTSPPGLISFSSLSSLTHSRQLIISLFPQIPQCTCNYHSYACLPPASCLEGGVSRSLSLSTSLSPPPLLLCFPSFFFFWSLFFIFPLCHFFFSPSCPLPAFTSLLSHSFILSFPVYMPPLTPIFLVFYLYSLLSSLYILSP